MNSLIRIKIEERVYSIQRFNPMEGMEFGTKLLSVISPAFGGIIESTKDGGDPAKVGVEIARALKDPELAPMLRRAIGQCWTPENESLADEAVFNMHFSKYPSDMFNLGVQATYSLVKDFFPSQLATVASGWQTKLAPIVTKTEPQ